MHKAEILAVLKQQQIAYTIDASNQEPTYLRNRIRHQVLPALRSCDARFEASFLRTLAHLTEAEDFCASQARQTLTELTVHHAGQAWLAYPALLEQHPFLIKQVILAWLCAARVPFTPSEGLFNEIIRFLQQAPGGTHIVSDLWYIVKKQKRASIHIVLKN
jgi:tRNA(Ile)-lysidine synthase